MTTPNDEQEYVVPLIMLHSVVFPSMPATIALTGAAAVRVAKRGLKLGTTVGFVLTDAPFGPKASEGIYRVGTCAAIQSVERTSLGTLSALVVGAERFLISALSEPYQNEQVAIVTRVTDQPSTSNTLAIHARKLHRMVLTYLDLIAARLGESVPPVTFPESPEELSMCVASIVIGETDLKQELLELTDTATRLHEEMHWLQEEIRRLHEDTMVARQFSLDDEQVRESIRYMRN